MRFVSEQRHPQPHFQSKTRSLSTQLLNGLLQVYDACLGAIIKATPVPVPRVWYIFATVGYQTSVLLKRANLCPEKTIDKLKKITDGSGKVVRSLTHEEFSKICKVCHNEQHRWKVLLNCFHLNGHTFRFHPRLKIKNLLLQVQHNKQHHRKVLLSNFHLNVHTSVRISCTVQK